MFLNYMFSYFLPYAILSYKCILKVFAAHAKAGAKRFQEYIQIERRKKMKKLLTLMLALMMVLACCVAHA